MVPHLERRHINPSGFDETPNVSEAHSAGILQSYAVLYRVHVQPKSRNLCLFSAFFCSLPEAAAK